MTIYVPFTPKNNQPFSFQATLDGSTYQLQVSWLAAGNRWYLSCIGNGNTLVFYKALIGSPDTGNINNLAGYFIANTLVFRVSTQTFEIGP